MDKKEMKTEIMKLNNIIKELEEQLRICKNMQIAANNNER